MALVSSTENGAEVSRRIRIESQGVAAPEKTPSGGVSDIVLGGGDELMEIRAGKPAEPPEFLRDGIAKFCRPHGKAIEFMANLSTDAFSGRQQICACFMCEDGHVVAVFWIVGESDAYSVDFLFRDGKVASAKGSCRVCVVEGEGHRVPRERNEHVIELWNFPDREKLELSVLGEGTGAFPCQVIRYSDLKATVGVKASAAAR